MTTPTDVVPVSESPAYASRPSPLDEKPSHESAFQEINERRARVENSELLQQLRGL
jgi:hypothetical protein